MTDYFGPDIGRENVITIPGSEYIVQTLREMEASFGKKLPSNFSLSLWMATYLAIDGPRQELILPNNPQEEASYLLFFGKPDSYNLKDSLLVRITDRPQSLQGLINHPEIDKIIRDLRRAYDGREIKRVRKNVRVPTKDWSLNYSFKAEPHEITLHLVYPENGTNLAHDFEEVLQKYNAIEDMLKLGYKDLYERTEGEIVLIRVLT
jgi:hypothetical protein